MITNGISIVTIDKFLKLLYCFVFYIYVCESL